MKLIAEKAGVSQATVSRVLSNHPSVSPAKRKKVMEWVRKLNFEPNYTARTLAANASQMIGVVLPDMKNPYFTDVLFHIERITNQNGYSIIVCNSNGDSQKEKSIIRQLKARQVDGILIGFAHFDSELVEQLKSDPLKAVTITQTFDGLDGVSISHLRGGALAAEHLLSQNVDDFVYFGKKEDDKQYGFRDHLIEHGVDEDCIHVVGDTDWYYNMLQRGYKTLHEFISHKKTVGKLGVFTVSDVYALAVMQTAMKMGMRVPEDISIVGFDNIFLCEAVQPRITSISQPIEQIAQVSLDLLFKKIEGKSEGEETQQIILQPDLVRRDT